MKRNFSIVNVALPIGKPMNELTEEDYDMLIETWGEVAVQKIR